MIFPRGPLHVIGHTQLIPSVDPEPDALLISGTAICVCLSVWVCNDAWVSHRGHSEASSMATEGMVVRQGQMKDVGVLQN